MLALAGCGKRGGGSAVKSPVPKETPPEREVLTGPGSLLRKEEPISLWIIPINDYLNWPLVKAYEVHYQESDLTYQEVPTNDGKTQKNYGGTMETVTGTLYKDDQPIATFTADRAEGHTSSSQLDLNGHVRVVSLPPAPKPGKQPDGPTTLTCDHLQWLRTAKVVKAQGGVKVVGDRGTVGPMDELWSTDDLKTQATPDLFPTP